MVANLRAFLRFLASAGEIPTGRDTQIDTPRVYRGEKLPRALPWDTVRALLQTIDCTSPLGRVAEREELTETGLGSTAICCGRRRHRQANSVARVLTDVKARRFAPPRSAGLTALTPAPRPLVQIGSCRRCSLIHPLHVVVDVPSRMTLFRATADTAAHAPGLAGEPATRGGSGALFLPPPRYEINDRPMKKLGVSRRALYEQLDRPALRPLPAARYVLTHWKLCRVTSTTTSRSSTTSTACRTNWSASRSRSATRSTRSRSSTATSASRRTGGASTDSRRPCPGHMPSAHRAHAEWSPSRLIGTGPRRLDRRPGRSSPKSCRAARTPSRAIALAWGSCRLGRRHGNIRFEAACTRALALGFCHYQTVKNILSAGQDRLPLEPPAETNPTPTHANIRDAEYYATTHEEEDRC